MKEPVFCTLDYRTYEKEVILFWLTKKCTSPINPNVKLAEEQKAEAVLISHKFAKDVINAFNKEPEQQEGIKP